MKIFVWPEKIDISVYLIYLLVTIKKLIVAFKIRVLVILFEFLSLKRRVTWESFLVKMFLLMLPIIFRKLMKDYNLGFLWKIT